VHSTRGIIVHTNYGSDPGSVQDGSFSFGMDESYNDEPDISQYFSLDRFGSTKQVSHSLGEAEKNKDVRIEFQNPGTLQEGVYHLYVELENGGQVPFAIEIGNADPTGS
jgi:hypothetical protein